MKKLKIAKINVIIFFLILYPMKAYAVDTMLSVVFEPNLPPYQFEENGEFVGLHIDILNSIAKKNNFIIEYLPRRNSQECIDALVNGEADIILGNIKSKDITFGQGTDSISQSSIIMISSDENAFKIKNNSKGSITAVLEYNSIAYSFIQKMKNIRYIVVSNQIRAYDLLKSNETDVLIGVKDSILYQIKKDKAEDDYTIINNFMVPVEYAMVIKEGNNDLLEKINNELQQLRVSGDYEKIYNKWIDTEKNNFKQFFTTVIIIIAIILIISLGIFIFNFRLNKILRREVDEKTKELQKINEDLQSQIIETRNNNELKNRIVEHSPSGIIAFDTDYKITLFNQSARKLTNLIYFPIGQSIFDIPLLKNILNENIEKIFKEDIKIINEEITLKNEDSNNIIYRYDIYQLYNFDNSYRGAIITVDDVTKELKLKEQVFEKEKNIALNQIIAGIAHEIRNPLTSIKTFVQLIPFKKDSQHFLGQLADVVPKEVDRVNSLIKNLIDYAKPETNNKQILNVNEIVKSCTILLEPTILKNNIVLSITEEDNLSIMADKNQLKQVLINLILNSIDSMTEKIKQHKLNERLHLIIRIWGNGENVLIQIVDEGMGMTDEEIKKSIEPFYTNKSNGTGLGLSLSKQYVEENNGTLSIESEKFSYTRVTLKFGRLQ